MTNYRDIIIKPLVTEKSIKLNEGGKVVTFVVRKDANAILIKQAVESIFNVKVLKVNTQNVDAKTKRVGRYVGKTNSYKKAIITLKEGSTINILSDK